MTLVSLINSLLRLSSTYSPILPLGIFLYSMVFSKISRINRTYQPIIFYIIFSFLSDIISLQWRIEGNNYLIIHIYGMIQFICLMTYYQKSLNGKSKTCLSIGIAYTVYYILNSWLIEPLNTFNSHAFSLQSILFIILSLLYFYQLYEKVTNFFIDQSPDFWFNTAIITYFSIALFSFTMSSEILSGPLPWAFHNLGNTLKNALIAIGIIMLWKKVKLTSKI